MQNTIVISHEPSKYQQDLYDAFANSEISIAVNAVAGSGKTSSIVGIANRLPANQRHDTICLAFNVAIRDEFAKRLPPSIETSNFHRLGKQVLQAHLGRSFGGKTGVNQWKYSNIIQDLLGGREIADREDVRNISEALNFCQLTLTNPAEVDELDDLCDLYGIIPVPGMSGIISQVIDIGVKQAEDGFCIDFNDMVFLPILLEAKFDTYRNVIVDECQDLNAVQREMVLKLQKSDGRTVAVGDPRQAIMGFAGADAESFSTLSDLIEAEEMPLSVCYRCPVSHIELAKAIVPQIEAATGAIEGIVDHMEYDKVFAEANPRAGDMILSRTTAPLVTLVFDFIKRQIPAKIKGRSDTLKTIVTLARKIEAIGQDQIKTGTLKGGASAWLMLDGLLTGYQIEEEVRLKKRYPNDGQKVASFIDRCDSLRALYSASLESNIRDLGSFEKWIQQFFDEVINGCVVLSTVHRAKGLEADTVYILDESKMPHPMARTPDAMIQEMNLRYVALTRAKRRLVFLSPKAPHRGIA